MMDSLKSLWISLKEFVVVLFDTVFGIFFYASRFRQLERQKQKQDEHYQFRVETKRKMSKWVTKERNVIAKLRVSNQVPKKLRDDYSFYNYVATVLMVKNPNWTLEQGVKHFYDYIHPFLIAYHSVYREMKHIAHSDEKEFLRKQEGLKRKIAAIPDIYTRASQVLAIKKKIALEVKETENKYQKHKKQTSEKLDLEMLRIDREIAERQRQSAEEKIKALDEKKE